MRPLLIGQAPSRSRARLAPLSGQSGRRLARYCDVNLAGFLHMFERRNLLTDWPGKAPGGGDLFPVLDGRRAADAMREAVSERVVVLLGAGVARAFRLHHLPILTWSKFHKDSLGAVAVCPHPSGRSRWWNDPANREAAIAFWRELAGRQPRTPWPNAVRTSAP